MGPLDDAIREHLDLKRRRGADPAEVERAEREALGPVRRVAEGHDEADGGLEFAQPTGEAAYEFAANDELVGPPEFAADHDHADELSAERGWHEPYEEHDEQPPAASRPMAADPAHERPLEPVGDPAIEHPHEPPPPAVAQSTEPPPASADRLFFEQEPEEEPAYEHAGDETVEYDVEHALEAESAGAAEGEHEDDVLEETPEFLQDTPDHDRLWFEQKPPRDFDFDG